MFYIYLHFSFTSIQYNCLAIGIHLGKIRNGVIFLRKILIVDDERQMQSLISFCITSEQFEIKTASTGKEALEILIESKFDLLLLDIMMPEMDGFQVLDSLKQKGIDVPTIILSAMGETEQIVKGLNLGAFDYVTKPFEPKELVARVHAVLRRTQPVLENKVKSLHGIHYDEVQHIISYQNKAISFTKKEYQIFVHLFLHPGRVYTREQLMYLIWDEAEERDYRNVDTHVKNIRTKLKQAGLQKPIVDTVWSIGYRIAQEEISK